MNKEEFNNLKYNLTNHHRKGIDNSYTADPIFLVQVKRITWGFEEEYAKHHQLCCSCDETYYNSVEEFFSDWGEDELEYLVEGTPHEGQVNRFKIIIGESLENLEDFLRTKSPRNGWEIVHGNEQWETVNWFITKSAAEGWLASKRCQLGDNDNVRIYVVSNYRSKELQNLLDAIIDGEVVWNG